MVSGTTVSGKHKKINKRISHGVLVGLGVMLPRGMFLQL